MSLEVTVPADPPQVACTDLSLLTTMVCHYLINAYAGAVSHLELLTLDTQSAPSENHQKWSNTIIQSAVQASAVARRLSDAAASHRSDVRTTVALDQFVENAVDAFTKRCGTQCAWTLQLEPVTLSDADPTLLSVMFTRLLENACEAATAASGSAEPRVEISMTRPSADWAQMAISNPGEVIPDSVRTRVFEPFFTTKPGHQGIGLTIAKAAWRYHQGSMRFVPKPEGGATLQLRVATRVSGTG